MRLATVTAFACFGTALGIIAWGMPDSTVKAVVNLMAGVSLATAVTIGTVGKG